MLEMSTKIISSYIYVPVEQLKVTEKNLCIIPMGTL